MISIQSIKSLSIPLHSEFQRDKISIRLFMRVRHNWMCMTNMWFLVLTQLDKNHHTKLKITNKVIFFTILAQKNFQKSWNIHHNLISTTPKNLISMKDPTFLLTTSKSYLYNLVPEIIYQTLIQKGQQTEWILKKLSETEITKKLKDFQNKLILSSNWWS